MNIEQMKVIVCLKMMRVEQYEQLNVGAKELSKFMNDKSDNILIKQATKRGYIECENGGSLI